MQQKQVQKSELNNLPGKNIKKAGVEISLKRMQLDVPLPVMLSVVEPRIQTAWMLMDVVRYSLQPDLR